MSYQAKRGDCTAIAGIARDSECRPTSPHARIDVAKFAFVTAVTLLIASPVLAQDAADTPICTDRPTKANATCTVPVGTWQLESSVVGWSRTEAGGAETAALTLGSSVLKLGLSDRSDLQLGFTPYVHAETRAGGIKSTASGAGDLTVRYKHRLTASGAPVQLGLIPFVKLPTADHDIGNGKVEGGLAVPIAISTGGPVTVLIGPELDLLADADRDGHHAAVVNLVNVSAPIAPGLTLAGEFWTMTNFDPSDTVTLASADAALAYAVSPAVQLDLGANFGLTRHTADAELYVGASVRF
jgi:hypothetical protein